MFAWGTIDSWIVLENERNGNSLPEISLSLVVILLIVILANAGIQLWDILDPRIREDDG